MNLHAASLTQLEGSFKTGPAIILIAILVTFVLVGIFSAPGSVGLLCGRTQDNRGRLGQGHRLQLDERSIGARTGRDDVWLWLQRPGLCRRLDRGLCFFAGIDGSTDPQVRQVHRTRLIGDRSIPEIFASSVQSSPSLFLSHTALGNSEALGSCSNGYWDWITPGR